MADFSPAYLAGKIVEVLTKNIESFQ